MKIVILDAYSVNTGDLSWATLDTLGRVTAYDRTTPDLVVTRAADADAILTNKVVITAEMMRALPSLRYIGVLATGYNVVDIDAARNAGIVVTNIPAYSTASVAQMVFAHLLAIVNRVEHYAEANRSGKWSSTPDFCYRDTPLRELAAMKLGVVGLGNIGCAVAHIASAFGMQVLAYTSKDASRIPDGITKVSLDRLLSESDVVTLHCPLTTQTRHMIDARALSLMKRSAILINTGRGPLVDEQALADALNSGAIHAAGLDVLSTEPPARDNPLLTAANCYITPHIAWATAEARKRLLDIAADNLRAFAAGNPRNNVAL